MEEIDNNNIHDQDELEDMPTYNGDQPEVVNQSFDEGSSDKATDTVPQIHHQHNPKVLVRKSERQRRPNSMYKDYIHTTVVEEDGNKNDTDLNKHDLIMTRITEYMMTQFSLKTWGK